jgi:predicted ATPase
MEAQLRRAELFESLRRLLVRAAEIRPQVLVLEDLHWVDQATEDFLRTIADSIPTSRVLCLFTYRPGYVHPFGERTYHTRMALPTLSTTDSMHMAQAILETGRLPTELEALIVQKAEGNPFFLEEVVKSLQEVGAMKRVGDQYALTKPLEEIVVPDTIQDVLMARIDRLEEAPKYALQLAAVIGREFTYRLLDRLADFREPTEGYLQELKAIELIYQKGLYPELAYMFKHALTQDVAYNSLLIQRRKDLHRLIGCAIEELYVDRLVEHYEVLAYHFTRGEAWAKALDYLCKAANKAAQAFATRDAVALYDQALEMTDRLGQEVEAQTVMAIHQAKVDL